MQLARVATVVLALALIGATLEPLVRDPYDDGFPLSTYPMFATKRPTQQTFHYALGETRDGKRRVLVPSLVGSRESLQALRMLAHAVGQGRTEMARLCEDVAARVAHEDEFADVVAIRFVTGTHDAIDYLSGAEIGPEVERYRCEVHR